MAVRKIEFGDPIIAYLDINCSVKGIGFVRYIGPLEQYGMRQYVGIDLIEPISFGHNGTILGVQCM